MKRCIPEWLDLYLRRAKRQMRPVQGVPARKEVLMNAIANEPLNLNSEELAVMGELLESERTKLLIEIRHTCHRAFRDELHRRLALVEELAERCQPR